MDKQTEAYISMYAQAYQDFMGRVIHPNMRFDNPKTKGCNMSDANRRAAKKERKRKAKHQRRSK